MLICVGNISITYAGLRSLEPEDIAVEVLFFIIYVFIYSL